MDEGTDALSMALNMSLGGINGKKGSFFPAARLAGNDRSELQDMLNQSTETQFLAKPTPSPSPTPSAVKPSKMTLAQLFDHFGVPNPIRSSGASSVRPLYQNKPDQQIYDWRSNYA